MGYSLPPPTPMLLIHCIVLSRGKHGGRGWDGTGLGVTVLVIKWINLTLPSRFLWVHLWPAHCTWFLNSASEKYIWSNLITDPTILWLWNCLISLWFSCPSHTQFTPTNAGNEVKTVQSSYCHENGNKGSLSLQSTVEKHRTSTVPETNDLGWVCGGILTHSPLNRLTRGRMLGRTNSTYH